MTIEGGMEIMHSNLKLVEAYGKSFLKQVSEPSTSQPPNGSLCQPQTSNFLPFS
jgi:hypothetical protein